MTEEELRLLRCVRDTDFAGDASKEAVDRAVKRGLIVRVAGSSGGLALATPGLRTLWNHERAAFSDAKPWERCDACGGTNLSVTRAMQSKSPIRVDCQRCGFRWTPADAV